MRYLLKSFSTFIVLAMALSISLPCQGQENIQPKGLSAALHAVMTHHPALKGKQAEVKAGYYVVDSAKAGRFPTISGQANNINDSYNQGVLRLQQPLWAFGKIDTGIEQAKANYATEETSLWQVRRRLIENTVNAYARIEGITQRGRVADINIDEHEQLHRRIKRRSKGQVASEADVRLAYSRLIQARAQRRRIDGEQQVALTELYALTQVKVAVDQPVDPILSILPENLEALALKNSADVQNKKKHIEVAQITIKQEKIASLPTIFAVVEQEFLDSPENGDETRAGISIQGSLEGLGFVSRGRIKGATASLNAAREDLKVAEIEVVRKLDNLRHNRSLQKALRISQSEAVEIVEQTMESFIRQYESGRKSWLDVLNTQRELTELRYQLVQINNEWLILSLRIGVMVGNLDQLAGLKTL